MSEYPESLSRNNIDMFLEEYLISVSRDGKEIFLD